ncbi:unnamed protein product [Hymenolepis diminuta]|uniref:Fe2OG dioxygenase domain-containing protein n=1 Tax=Hymenolepis diminuta TaxID=6216 RepID=A0A0R3SFG5_HYMDI|nr:unnamed protein product [Hymenolepis diminuta]
MASECVYLILETNFSTSWPAVVAPFIIPNAPKTFFYVPDFIDAETEAELLQNIYASGKWQYLAHRRLQIWGGAPHPKGMIAEKIPDWLHSLMDRISDFGVFGPYRANHVLINEYKPGEGIMPHHDGPLYYPVVTTVNLGGHSMLDFYYPITDDMTDVSFKSRYVGSALLMPRSMNMVTDSLYTYYMHGIEEKKVDYLHLIKNDFDSSSFFADPDSEIEKKILNLSQIPQWEDLADQLERKTRISITIRHVPKTRKVNLSRLFKGTFS